MVVARVVVALPELVEPEPRLVLVAVVGTGPRLLAEVLVELLEPSAEWIPGQ
ncbi:hypothetical protein [Bacillus sp. ISL-77]|uniref:hypothetical protein n=1 Tax=Bacillus sp. ISL-77 TaxID=2819138 RepID=UPI001BE70C08|nr:hypothetical protein [Bacillus sp. ISL-77]MBT2743229.1 hypothetical protein [Bacillus sp. ISL-77]